MNFTNSPYEPMMKQKSYIRPPAAAQPPKGSRCPYWRGVGGGACYRELLKAPSGGR